MARGLRLPVCAEAARREAVQARRGDRDRRRAAERRRGPARRSPRPPRRAVIHIGSDCRADAAGWGREQIPSPAPGRDRPGPRVGSGGAAQGGRGMERRGAAPRRADSVGLGAGREAPRQRTDPPADRRREGHAGAHVPGRHRREHRPADLRARERSMQLRRPHLPAQARRAARSQGEQLPPLVEDGPRARPHGAGSGVAPTPGGHRARPLPGRWRRAPSP